MKVNVRSIKFKLLAIGLFSVLIPLLVVGAISVTKASNALMSLSSERVTSIAQDLSSLVNQTLMSEIKMARTFSSSQTIIQHVSALNFNKAENETESVKILFENLKKKFEEMGSSYQGIFVADAKGNILTGILEDGKEYKGINISQNHDFIRAIKSGEALVGDMIISQATGKPVVTVISPIK